MKNRIMLLIVSVIFASCSNGKLIKSIPIESSLESEINKKGRKNSAKIKLIDKQIISTKDLFIQTDSIRYCNLEDSSVSVISLGYVKEIRFVHRFEGALFGMITGGLLVRILGYIKDNANREGFSNNGQAYMIGGAILGVIFGGTSGIHRYYEFETDKEISIKRNNF